MACSRFAVVALVLVACGGGSSSVNTIGTLPPSTLPPRTLSTATTLPPQPPAPEDLVITINRMPDGWVQVDDMSGPITLEAIDDVLLDGLGDLGIVNAYRATFARSATSELAALARSGAELVVSLALEMESADAAGASIEVLQRAVAETTVRSRDVSSPGQGVRLELTGGIFVLAWWTDNMVQVVVANGVPASNIDSIAILVPEVP